MNQVYKLKIASLHPFREMQKGVLIAKIIQKCLDLIFLFLALLYIIS